MDENILLKVFKKSDNAVFRKIADEFILVPVHKDAVDLEALFSFNATAARIWELLDGKLNGREITEIICGEFNQQKDTVGRDIAEFFIKLEEMNFVNDVSLK